MQLQKKHAAGQQAPGYALRESIRDSLRETASDVKQTAEAFSRLRGIQLEQDNTYDGDCDFLTGMSGRSPSGISTHYIKKLPDPELIELAGVVDKTSAAVLAHANKDRSVSVSLRERLEREDAGVAHDVRRCWNEGPYHESLSVVKTGEDGVTEELGLVLETQKDVGGESHTWVHVVFDDPAKFAGICRTLERGSEGTFDGRLVNAIKGKGDAVAASLSGPLLESSEKRATWRARQAPKQEEIMRLLEAVFQS